MDERHRDRYEAQLENARMENCQWLEIENAKLSAEIARLQGDLHAAQNIIQTQANQTARLRAALEAQLEAHNYAEVLEIARKALANEQ